MNEALKIIIENIEPLDAVETGIDSAYNKVLAEDIKSDIDIPPFNKSAMDGYAVRSSDLDTVPVALKVIDVIPAGCISTKKIQDRACIKIMTGAPVPSGADSVIIIEDTEKIADGRVLFSKKCEPGQNVCVKGEDIRKGDIVLRKGALIRGAEIAILASVGKTEVSVIRTPSIGIVSTGNEIVEPSQPLQNGKIRNSNGPMLTALGKALGCDVEYLGIAGDEEDELGEVIRKGFQKDILLLSGGVSAGDYDLIPALLQKDHAVILFHKIRVKPGKPLLFARKGKCRIFGIPGNPVSNFTTFQIFIKPAVLRMMGRPDYCLQLTDAVMSVDFHNKSRRVHIVPSHCSVDKGSFYVTPFTLNGSADIIGCSDSNCLAVIEEGTGVIRKGKKVKIVLLNE